MAKFQNYEETEERPSRSQRKRDSTALQKLGEKMVKLSPSALAKLPLSPLLRRAVLEWRTIPTFEGKRRQLQYVGRLMREEADVLALQQALEKLTTSYSASSAAFKHLEILRDTLLNAQETELNKLLQPFGTEASNLRALVLAARDERANNRTPRMFRLLFKRLKALAEENEHVEKEHDV